MSNEELNDPSDRKTRSERGLKSQETGQTFEKQVAELFRLLHYEVEPDRLFSGRQVDLFLTGRFGDLTLHRAIECKAGPVSADHIDSFLAKLRLVQKEYPSALGTIVSGASFTSAVKSQAHCEGVQLTLIRDLAASLFDGHAYVARLIRDCESHERYPLEQYVETFIGYDISGESHPSATLLNDWLADGEWNQLTLLGDVGTGKSFLSRILAHRLARAFLAKPQESPVPVLIDLREADRQFSLEGLVLTHLARCGLQRISFEAFQQALAQGNLVLILDGFDEMAARVTPNVTNRNFQELSRCIKGRAKVLLTCRTHYFKSRTEAEEVILGSRHDYGSETARDLYWELISRKGYRIAYLRPFEISQIEEYVHKAKPQAAKQALEKIRRTYNLIELSQRPMLLEMIVKSIDRLSAKEINPATLYSVYTDAWVHRDQWRDVLSADAKTSLLMALARSLWTEDKLKLHYNVLLEYVKIELANKIQNPHDLIEIDTEVRTATFLTRDQAGNYGFAHKSYMEFFLAKYIAAELDNGRTDCLRTRRCSPETVDFIGNLCDRDRCEQLLVSLLITEYKPLVSENALAILYGLRKARSVAVLEAMPDSAQFPRIDLPPGIRLSGAQLEEITLENADMTHADLSNANLGQAILCHANLSHATIHSALLTKADLRHVDLTHSSITDTTLMGANLEHANLSDSTVSRVDLTDTLLLNCTHHRCKLSDLNLTRAILPETLFSLRHQTSSFLRGKERETLDSATPWLHLYACLRPLARRVQDVYNIDANDLIQDTLIQLFRQPGTMEMSDDARSEKAVSIFRQRVARLRHSDTRFVPLDEIDLYDSNTNQLDELLAQESSDSLDFVLGGLQRRLSAQLWRVAEARFVQQMSLSAIAQREGLSSSTVHRMLVKITELARRELKGFAPR